MKWVLFCFSLLVVSCQNKPIASSKKPASVKNYISLDLDYPEYQNTLNKLDAFLGTKLKNRGEAHVTVVTPPEFKILTANTSSETLHQEWQEWKTKTFKKICLGEGQIKEKNKILKTYYVVIEAPELLAFRKYLQERYAPDTFKPESFYPHITLGFTEKDLHFEQGVIKNAKSCPEELQPLL